MIDQWNMTPEQYAAAGSPVFPNGVAHLMPRIKVAHVTHDGATAIIPAVELMQFLEDGGSYMVRLSDMMQRDFDLLPEFGGW